MIIFEDDHARRLGPVSLTRPAFAVTCGGWTLQEVACLAHCQIRHIVRNHLQESSRRDYPDSPSGEGPTLFLNASLVPDVGYVRAIRELLLENSPRTYTCGERLAAALLPADRTVPTGLTSTNVTGRLKKRNLPKSCEFNFRTIDDPRQLIRLHRELFPENIPRRIVQSDYPEVQDGVFAAPGTQVAETAVFHTANGPVLLDEGVRIMDFAYVQGPAYVGPGSVITERTSIKQCVSIGRGCTVGGEIEATIIEPCSNKPHHGFLGHAWVGSWVNLAAGTSNEDIPNSCTKMGGEHPNEGRATGSRFKGCLIGDYSSSSINTGILNGTVIGVASSLCGYVGRDVPSFCRYAPPLGPASKLPLQEAISRQKDMFRTREVKQTRADTDLLGAVHDLTRQERPFADERSTS